jgi:hypothetical protein
MERATVAPIDAVQFDQRSICPLLFPPIRRGARCPKEARTHTSKNKCTVVWPQLEKIPDISSMWADQSPKGGRGGGGHVRLITSLFCRVSHNFGPAKYWKVDLLATTPPLVDVSVDTHPRSHQCCVRCGSYHDSAPLLTLI